MLALLTSLRSGVTCNLAASCSNGVLHHVVARSYASGKDDDDKPKKLPDRGLRYGVRLRRNHPDKFKRMRAILGYYDLPTSDPREAPANIDKVTINIMQTMKYLDLGPDTPEIHRRLANYRILGLNRELEEMHGKTRQLLTDMRLSEAKPAIPSLLLSRAGRGRAQ